MPYLLLFLVALLVLPGCQADAPSTMEERTDWQTIFEQFDARGTLVISDQRDGNNVLHVYDNERASRRYSPASTYKIPHTLFALDAGVVHKNDVFPWDGVERGFAAHNQDQNLRSAMQTSALWVYQQFDSAIGQDRARYYLQQTEYGNADPTVAEGTYWVDGNLAISAHEQISFLNRLYQNDLPFSDDHQNLVKELMVSDQGDQWVLRAKTGWEGRWGWWTGWVEQPEGPVFFALNIDTPGRMDDLYKREAITRAVLQQIGALPDDGS